MTTEALFENEIAKITYYMREVKDMNCRNNTLYFIRVETKNKTARWRFYDINTPFSSEARKIFMDEINRILV